MNLTVEDLRGSVPLHAVLVGPSVKTLLEGWRLGGQSLLGVAYEKVAFIEAPSEPEESSAEALDSPEIEAAPTGPDISARKQAQFERIHALRTKGHSFRGIAVELDLSRNTVKKYARLDRCPERVHSRRARPLAAHEPYLVEQFNAGQRNARRLWEQVRAQGFTGSASVMRHFMTGVRRQHGVRGRRGDLSLTAPKRPCRRARGARPWPHWPSPSFVSPKTAATGNASGWTS